ncbi:MAG: tetratricopeptide repeat protein [Planctomycetota bacterium]|nr:tetratricopeptide repeat protein [Planctomycetota bacterium]
MFMINGVRSEIRRPPIAKDLLGTMLQALGRFGEAEQFHREALEENLQLRGPDHPVTLDSMHVLGMLLLKEGKFDDAMPYLDQAMRGRELVLGPDHRDTIESMNGMAAVLQSKGMPEQALPLLHQTVQRNCHLHGPDHPVTISSMDNLGTLLHRLGRTEEAEELIANALERTQLISDEATVHFAILMTHHAAVLLDLGHFQSAMESALKAYTILESKLATSHPHIIATMQLLVDLYSRWHLLDSQADHTKSATRWQLQLDSVEQQ